MSAVYCRAQSITHVVANANANVLVSIVDGDVETAVGLHITRRATEITKLPDLRVLSRAWCVQQTSISHYHNRYARKSHRALMVERSLMFEGRSSGWTIVIVVFYLLRLV